MAAKGFWPLPRNFIKPLITISLYAIRFTAVFSVDDFAVEGGGTSLYSVGGGRRHG